MKTIRLKENKINRYSKTMLEDYICSFGIARENVNSFIGTPRPTDADDPFKLKNINTQPMSALKKAKLENIIN